MAGAASFEWPFPADAVLSDIAKFLPAGVDFKRALADAMSKFNERDKAVEDSLSVPSGSVPIYNVDPTSGADGTMWINGTTGQLKVRIGGANRVVTVT